MIWHEDKLMQQVSPLFSIAIKSIDEDLCVFRQSENGPVLTAFRRHEVGATRRCSMLWCRHFKGFLQRLKPLGCRYLTRGLKPPPPKEKASAESKRVL